MSDETLTSILGLHRELQRREREENNYIAAIEQLAQQELRAVGHTGGALTHRTVSDMAQRLGLQLIYVSDLPHSTRSLTDLENGRIYLPPASVPGGHGLRSMALQAIAHQLLEHASPTSYADFLRQRLEINYFAAACLIPEEAGVAFLQQAKKDRNLAVEDFRDAFGVTHESAALRMTNLMTEHLAMPLHFLRVAEDGAITRAYENDGLPLPQDVTGSVEGLPVCRRFQARSVLRAQNRPTEQYQYTDTPAGSFWCATQTGSSAAGEFSISIGVPYQDTRWCRGRETTARAQSSCPDEACCRRPAPEASARWDGRAWPSARVHTHMFSPLPRGAFPGVDEIEVYDFLERHAGEQGLTPPPRR